MGTTQAFDREISVSPSDLLFRFSHLPFLSFKMTVIHIVLFKFKPAVTAVQRAEFVKNAKSLKSLSCVKDGRLIVGGPSETRPISKSQGYDCALVSYHEDLTAVEDYHVTKEHERFDFEVDQEDESLVGVL